MSITTVSEIPRISQDDFLAEYWSCEAGEHVTIVGPTGCGKTRFTLRLLTGAHEQNPECRALALVMKPHKGPKSRGPKSTGDETIEKLTPKLGGRITRVWPPRPLWPWQDEPPFWAYWPIHSYDPAIDLVNHHLAFRRAILDSYKVGDRLLFADEAFSLAEELDLDDELVTLWTKARGMKTSLFAATQRPAYVPLWMYSEATHIFLWKMTAAYKRVREIGGSVDADLVVAAMKRLGRFDCIYLNPRENLIAIINGR